MPRPVWPLYLRLKLSKQIEDPREPVGCDTDATVADDDLRLRVPLLRAQCNTAAAPGVLRRIAEQVADRLRKAQTVTVYLQRLVADLAPKHLTARLDQRFGRFTARAIRSPTLMTSGLSVILPRVMRDTSSRSSTRRVSCASWRSIMSRDSCTVRVLDRFHAA